MVFRQKGRRGREKTSEAAIIGHGINAAAARGSFALTGAIAASIIAGAAIPAHAQDAVVPLEGIVIVGEKVERSYLDTFTSVGVATGEDIKNYNTDDLNDSFNQMANVRSFSSNRGNNGFQIRGLNADGVTQPANSAPLISVIIDGATQSAEGLRRGSRGVWDVKQIEVLRGPQSALH